MKQPVTVTVAREFGNAGDVITIIRDADGEEQKLAVPGDCSPYHAISALRPFLEGALNGHFAPPDGEPELVTDPDTGDVSVVVDHVEVGVVPTPKKTRAAAKKAAQS